VGLTALSNITWHAGKTIAQVQPFLPYRSMYPPEKLRAGYLAVSMACTPKGCCTRRLDVGDVIPALHLKNLTGKVFTSIKALLENLEVVENELIPVEQLDGPFKAMAKKFYASSARLRRSPARSPAGWTRR
jgi:hypothetical protein